MSPVQLLTHFDRISEAPSAIPRLRRFILDLAVRGKLVGQDPSDEPAAALVKRIQEARLRLAKRGEIKRWDSLQPIEDHELPFELPVHWALVRLGEALDLINGRAFKPTDWTDTGLPIIRIQNLNALNAPFNYCDKPIPEKCHVSTGDFLISWSGTPGTSFGAHIWDRGDALLNQHIFRAELIGDAFVTPFLKLAINSRLFELIDQAHGGVGLQHITKPKLERLPLTLPPLAEQHRIVAKVEELMGLCDRLEAVQAERESRRDHLVAAALHRLNQAKDESDFREQARFYLGHLPRLTTRPEHIQQLRQTILDLAVRGKLVPQDPNDEPAPELLKRIKAEKKRQIADGQLKKQEALPEVRPDEAWFTVPAGWSWVRLGTITHVLMGQSPPGETYNKTSEGIPLINGPVEFTEGPFGKTVINQYTTAPTNLCEEGDLLICVRGSTTGRTNIAGFRACIGRGVAAIRLFFADHYVRLFIWRLRASIIAMGRGIAFPSVSRQQIEELPVPLPPLAEQHRIVAKADELMGLCDRLETQLTTAQTESRRLIESVLHQTRNGGRY